MNRYLRRLVMCLLFLVNSTLSVQADQDLKSDYYADSTFWGALIYASNSGEKSTVDVELEKKLKQAFKEMSYFQLLGQHTQKNVLKST